MRKRSKVATWLAAASIGVACLFAPSASAQVIGGVGGGSGGGADPADPLYFLQVADRDYTFSYSEMESQFDGPSGQSLCSGAMSTFYRAEQDFEADQTWYYNGSWLEEGDAYRLEWWDLGVNTVVDDSVYPAIMGTGTPLWSSGTDGDDFVGDSSGVWAVWDHPTPISFEEGHVYALVIIREPDDPASAHEETVGVTSRATFPSTYLSPAKRTADATGSFFDITDWDADPTTGTWVNNSSTANIMLRISSESAGLFPVAELHVGSGMAAEYAADGDVLAVEAIPPALQAGNGVATEVRHTFWVTSDPTGDYAASGITDRQVMWVRAKSALEWLGLEIGLDSAHRGHRYSIFVRSYDGSQTYAQVTDVLDTGSGNEYVRFDFDESFTTEVGGYYMVEVRRAAEVSNYRGLDVGLTNDGEFDQTHFKVTGYNLSPPTVAEGGPLGFGARDPDGETRPAWAFITGDDDLDVTRRLKAGSGIDITVVGQTATIAATGGGSLWNDDADGTISASNTVVTVDNDLEVQGTIRSEEGVSGDLNLKAEDHIDLELDSDNSAVGSLRIYDYNKANLRFWLDPFGDAGFYGDVTSRTVSVEGEVFGDPWNSSLEVPTKNDLYDYLITLENLSYLPEAQTEWSMTQTQLDTFLAGSFNGNSLITAGVKSIPFLASETFTFDGTLTKFTTGSGPTYFPHGIAWYHIGTGPTFSTVDFFAAYGSAPMVEVLDAVPTLLGAAEAGSWFMVPHDPIEFEAGEVYALVLIPDTDGTPEALTPNYYYYYSSGALPGLITGTKYTGSAAAQSDVYVHTAWSTDKTTGEWKARSDTGYAILRLVDADSSGVEVSTLAVDSTIQADYNAGTSTLGLSATPQQLQVGEGDAADDIQWFSTTGDEPSFSAADYGNNGAMVLMVRAETEQSWKGIRMRFDTAERNETWNFYVRDANNQITYAQKEAYADSGSGNESVSILFDEAFTTVEDRVYLIVAEHDYDSDHDYETYSTGLDWTTTEWTVLGHAGVDDGDNAFIPPGSLTSVPAMAPIIGDTGYRPTLVVETGDGIEVSYDAGTHTSTISARDFTQHRTWSFDPAAVCDGDVDRLFLMTVGQDLPDGANIVQWSLSFEADPTTEADVDFKYADAFIGVANSAVIDVCDTTAGVSGESTPANINGGAAVANGKVMYLEFGTEYTETGHQMVFEVWYESE